MGDSLPSVNFGMRAPLILPDVGGADNDGYQAGRVGTLALGGSHTCVVLDDLGVSYSATDREMSAPPCRELHFGLCYLEGGKGCARSLSCAGHRTHC
eukprot:4452583-Amphidinium_carterae.2